MVGFPGRIQVSKRLFVRFWFYKVCFSNSDNIMVFPETTGKIFETVNIEVVDVY